MDYPEGLMSLADFHPSVQRWFQERFGDPTPPQAAGWPAIRRGENCLIAAPTGSGKTLAAFLSAIDSLLAEGENLQPVTRVLYISPLKALGNDVAKNLEEPLRQLEEQDPNLARLRVAVRSGDTPASRRAAMLKNPPHLFVTTPESLYILLTSKGGRSLLKTVRTVIVDEIHAVLGSKRGAHLALSLERLQHLTEAPLQRIGLSATQKPLSDVAHVLCGVGRACTMVDIGHQRDADLAVCLPRSPLAPVCAHEVWDEIYEQLCQLIEAHRTSLIFVGSRKMAERVSARLTEKLSERRVTCHHSSLSKERRLDAETRLKAGTLSALVATASLELGIDVGEIDLVCQVGATRS
ncbi:MAG: DEAD/DEAH box helicase, partial [Planctomycetota bacterium]